MKAAHFIDTKVVGGAEVLVIELCRKLKTQDIEVEIFHFGNPWLEKKSSEYKIPAVIIPGHKYYKSIKTLPLFFIIFQKFLKKSGIDVLHSHLVDPITGASFATFLSRTPHVGTLHDTHTLEEQPAKLWLLQIAAALGTRMITVSKNVEDYIQKNIKLFKGSYKTIYNGVDLSRFNSSETDTLNLRESLDLGKNDIIFICVGRLVEIKGHEVLIEAFSKLKNRDNIRLLIVGDGPRRSFIKEKISSYKLKETVKLLGTRHDVPELLKISDCFVLSSHSEGLSCSIIEATAVGLPVVATDVGGNYELIRDSVSGYLVQPNSPGQFVEKLQKIIYFKGVRKKMGEESKNIVKEFFSLNSMVAAYCEIYREIQ